MYCSLRGRLANDRLSVDGDGGAHGHHGHGVRRGRRPRAARSPARARAVRPSASGSVRVQLHGDVSIRAACASPTPPDQSVRASARTPLSRDIPRACAAVCRASRPLRRRRRGCPSFPRRRHQRIGTWPVCLGLGLLARAARGERRGRRQRRQHAHRAPPRRVRPRARVQAAGRARPIEAEVALLPSSCAAGRTLATSTPPPSRASARARRIGSTCARRAAVA